VGTSLQVFYNLTLLSPTVNSLLEDGKQRLDEKIEEMISSSYLNPADANTKNSQFLSSTQKEYTSLMIQSTRVELCLHIHQSDFSPRMTSSLFCTIKNLAVC